MMQRLLHLIFNINKDFINVIFIILIETKMNYLGLFKIKIITFFSIYFFLYQKL